MPALVFRPVKINMDGSLLPPKLADVRLNRTFGDVLGRMSEDDVQAIVFRHVEIRIASKLRRLWASVDDDIVESMQTNDVYRTRCEADDEEWGPVAGELANLLDEDDLFLRQRQHLARGHIALCQKVIEELETEARVEVPKASYARTSPRDATVSRHLTGSAAACLRVGEQLEMATKTWNSQVNHLNKEAKLRLEFAATKRSIPLSHLDSLSPKDFERYAAWFLQREGCTVLQHHGGAKDQGADVIALAPDGRRVVLQCKHSTKPGSKVDPRYIYELNGTARPEHGADVVGIVTNRVLSANAETFARKHDIHIIDRPALTRWATYGASWLPAQ